MNTSSIFQQGTKNWVLFLSVYGLNMVFLDGVGHATICGIWHYAFNECMVVVGRLSSNISNTVK